MFKNISKSVIALGIMFTLVLGLSYGTFIYTSDSYRATEMLVSNLSYGIDITASDATVSGKTVNVSSGKTSTVALKVTSLNKIDTKYGVDYKITKGTGTVKYASNTGWLPTGKISENNVGTYEKVVKVVIAAETDMSGDFTVTGGFPNNELTEVASGYTRITEKAENIISYNDTLTTVIGKESSNNIYGGESTSNYLQYPINDDNTKNIWRILGTYNGIGTKIVSNQTSTTTKDTLSRDLTSFYNTLEKPDDYILTTDKFNCTNTSCTTSSYSKVGLISTSEYEMLGGINSYLASSESYFALDNGVVKNITSGGIEETSTSSGLRPAVYLQDYVTVTGSGTVSDPFKLKLPTYAVTLLVTNGTAKLPSKMITRGENATFEITPNTGYKLEIDVSTCSGTLDGNTFTITNITSKQTCKISLAPESYTLTFDPNGGSVSTTSKTITYDDTYGDLPTPTRTGYTFIGWYGSNVMPYGDFSNTNTNIWKANQSVTVSQGNGYYQVIYNQTNSTPGLIWNSTESLNLLELNKTYTLSMKVKGINTSKIGIAIYNSLIKSYEISQSEFTIIKETFTIPSKPTDYILLYESSPTLKSGFQIEWLKIEEGSVATPFKVTSSTTVTTPSDHKLVANWTANPLYSKLLADKTTRLTRTDFSTVLSTDNTKTLYTGTEEGKNVYYFAGNAQDNWVKFGKHKNDVIRYRGYNYSNFYEYLTEDECTNSVSYNQNCTPYKYASAGDDIYWRIIRTNSDGSIRLLYHGTSTATTTAFMGYSSYNSSGQNSMYIGYMYGTTGSLANNRTNENSSTIKTFIDNWYANNMTSYTKYLSTTAVYCNDREVGSGTYSATGASFNYAAYTRLRTNKTPTYDCTETSDAFSVNNTSAKLTYPIALMTADEISYAGGRDIEIAPMWYSTNSLLESSTGSTYWWLLSPYDWSDGAGVFIVDGSHGILSDGSAKSTYGVRPVVSLKSCVKINGGDGSASNPYPIALDPDISC